MMGRFWSILNPLIMILIYTLVFSKIMGARLPGTSDALGYSMYLCAGLLPWISFLEVLQRSATVFLEYGNLIKKVAFPREVLIGFVVLSSTVHLVISLGLFTGFLIITAHFPSPFYGVLPLLIVLQQVFALGLGLALSVLNVYFRDIAQLIGVVLQFWFWLTPIVYLRTVMPERLSFILKGNPMYYLVSMYQDIISYHRMPDLRSLGIFLGIALSTVAVGSLIFRQLDDELVDEL